MRTWRSLFEILKLPIEIIFIGTVILGIGNLLSNPSLGVVAFINNDYVQIFAELLVKIGQFIIVNFPIFILIRLVSRKSASAATVLSAFGGYAVLLATTMFFARTDLPTTAYSSILGLSLSGSSVPALASAVHYPLQVGIFGAITVSLIVLITYRNTQKKDEYGFFGFVSKDAAYFIRTIFFSFIAGIVFAFLWPYVIFGIQKMVSFISIDTTNPVNLSLFGVMDRVLSVFNMNTMIRQPFWFTSAGGNWTTVTGMAAQGDIAVWTAQLAGSSITSQAGRFFTPYYILNLFAVPGMIWAFYSLNTSKVQKNRYFLFAILATLASLLFGTLLPLELLLLVLCPLLFAMHLACTGILYALLQGFHIYLGFNSTSSATITAMPGTLMEYISYFSHADFLKTLLLILLIGVIFACIYFFMTRYYFKHLAADLFKTGEKDRLIEGTLKAVGGIENIRLTQSSITTLTLSLYDPDKLNIQRLKKLGSFRIYESRAGYHICYGASSTMVKIGIDKSMREGMRDANIRKGFSEETES